MRKDFYIFTLDRYTEFTEFVNGLGQRKKKFHVTPYLNSKGDNTGFVVWFYK